MSADSETDYLGPLAPESVMQIVFASTTIGWILQFFLSGCATTLVFSFWRENRRKGNKFWTINNTLLFFALLANLVATGMNAQETYHYLISQNRALANIYSYIPADIWVTVPQGCVVLCAQTYFAFRCYKLINRNKIFGAFIILPILGTFGLSIGAALMLQLSLDPSTTLAITETWLWLGAATDIIISSVLAVVMLKSKTGFSRTDDMLDRVIKLALRTAALPASFAIMAAIVFATTYSTQELFNIFTVFVTPLPSLYVISFASCIGWRAAEGSSTAGTAYPTYGYPTGNVTTTQAQHVTLVSPPIYPLSLDQEEKASNKSHNPDIVPEFV